MIFPPDTKAGDYFWMNGEPVRVSAWGYRIDNSFDCFFDIEFLEIKTDGKSAASMVLIPIGFEFYGTDIRRMSSLEMELF